MERRSWPASRCLFAVALFAGSHGAWGASVDLPNGLPSMVGGGVGFMTDYAGGKDRFVGLMPRLGYVTSSGRLLEWYGPYAQFDSGGLTGLQ